MEDMTARIIRALRKAAGNARCAEDATELNELADALDVEGAPIPAPTRLLPLVPDGDQVLKGALVDPASIPEQPPVSNEFVAPGAEPFSHLPLTEEQKAAAAKDDA